MRFNDLNCVLGNLDRSFNLGLGDNDWFENDNYERTESCANGIKVNHSNHLTLVENLAIAVRFSNRATVEVVTAEAIVDLAEFELAPQEIQKLTVILQRLNKELAHSLEKHCSAVSLTSEIRPASTAQSSRNERVETTLPGGS